MFRRHRPRLQKKRQFPRFRRKDADALTPQQADEYDGYIAAADLLSLRHAKARVGALQAVSRRENEFPVARRGGWTAPDRRTAHDSESLVQHIPVLPFSISGFPAFVRLEARVSLFTFPRCVTVYRAAAVKAPPAWSAVCLRPRLP
jgi:hypothetical protein